MWSLFEILKTKIFSRCGNGTQVSTRNCNSPSPQFGGNRKCLIDFCFIIEILC
jgi:hypothetical protein